ncbi:MAG: hypothetical protein KJ879_02940, partial [Nanoarchaeota archaeon]|nr:hypothetical protein [Nanoarchaeota archaeon]
EEVGDVVPEVMEYEWDTNNTENWYIDNVTGEKKLYATGLDYGALTPILTEAIKELKVEKDSEIASLKKENADLQNQVDELKAQINSIKVQLNESK